MRSRSESLGRGHGLAPGLVEEYPNQQDSHRGKNGFTERLHMIHVGGDNIESHSGKLLKLKTASEQGLISGKYRFDQRDVLYSKIRPALNKVVAPTFEGICSADIYPLRPINGKLCREYLVHLLRSDDFLEYTATCSSRTNIPKINRDALFAYEAVLPPLEEQRCIKHLPSSTKRPTPSDESVRRASG